ncbi:MAG TPA: ABC transporter permease [Clostridia bacterium]|jgi:tungstate transport system permease protein|nr:ABC transporter permease [Clostridia bacterium]
MGSALSRALTLLFAGDPLLISILRVTMTMTLFSSCTALLLGAPYGVLLASARFPGRKALILINRTLTGLPPVVCGLICYILFSGTGPMRGLHLLFTVAGMVVAQVLLITPIIAGSMETAITPMVEPIRESARGMGLTRGRTFLLTLNESKYALFSSYLLGFGRAMAEVGAVSMVGGAIAYKTNVMTTAIMMYTNMGNFSYALALGILLLLISLVVNIVAQLLQRSVGV